MTDRLYSRLDGTVRLADKLDKPLLDNRSYRVIRLPNQLEALLIHDPETDKASAAMDVDVGSLADDEAMQGMAHAVEHLLFMGTEKVRLMLAEPRKEAMFTNSSRTVSWRERLQPVPDQICRPLQRVHRTYIDQLLLRALRIVKIE